MSPSLPQVGNIGLSGIFDQESLIFLDKEVGVFEKSDLRGVFV